MIRLEEPVALLLAIPWLLFWLGFARVQLRACRWIRDHVDQRFSHRLTRYTAAGVRRHMGLLLALGLLLIVAAARPTVRGLEPVREIAGRVVLVIDGSASMSASDGAPVEPGGDERRVRFEEARDLAAELVRRLPDWRFALVTFSGVATLQLPLTTDTATVEEALRVVEVHNIYRATGSAFGGALDRLLPFAESAEGVVQAVILSDGEQPFPESYEEPLAAVAAYDMPVHAVAFGSEEGQTRAIYDFQDVVDGKEERSVLRQFTTRRVDEHLRRIARATGGTFTEAGPDAADVLTAALSRRQETSEGVSRDGRRDLSAILLGLFLLLFLAEAVLLAPPTRGSGDAADTFDPTRLGPPRSSRPVAPGTASMVWPAVLIAGLMGTAACRPETPTMRASRENEAGIEADGRERWAEARTHYERSIAFGELAQIPTHNLARSLTLQQRFSEAHDQYQRALEIEPGLATAHYNDGWTLFQWGEAERDPRGCQLERTRDLWSAAQERFAGAAELYEPDSAGEERSRRNHAAVSERLQAVDALIAEPPADCRADASRARAGGRGGGEGAQAAPSGPQASAPPNEEEGDQGPAGQGDDDSAGQGQGGADGRGGAQSSEGPAPLTPDEQQQIAEALGRLRDQGHAEGKYHRRTRAEQFPSDSWKNPEREIWW